MKKGVAGEVAKGGNGGLDMKQCETMFKRRLQKYIGQDRSMEELSRM